MATVISKKNTSSSSSIVPSTEDEEPRRVHRDSIALSFRRNSSSPRRSSWLTNDESQGESSRALQAMLQDIADWDAQQLDEDSENQQNDDEDISGSKIVAGLPHDTTTSTESATSDASSASTDKEGHIIRMVAPPAGQFVEEEQQDAAASIPRQQEVRFHMAYYHHHPRIIGDNPACSLGVPLSIDWKAVETTTLDLAQEEQDVHESKKKNLAAMYLTPEQRFRICEKQLGYTPKQINHSCQAVKVARAQRRRTVGNLWFQPLHEQLERLQRSVTKKMICKSSVAQLKHDSTGSDYKRSHQSKLNAARTSMKKKATTASQWKQTSPSGENVLSKEDEESSLVHC